MHAPANTDTPCGKMLLVVPPCFCSPGPDFEIGFPVHLLSLGKSVREQGWTVEYLDMTLEEKEGSDSFVELDRRLTDRAIQLVGISNHTVRTSITTKAVAERVKALRPETRIVVGGVNATFMWRELLTECHAIDWILRGYAQASLRALLDSLGRGDSPCAPGLVFRQGEGFHSEPMAPVTPADLATPSIDELPVDRYLEWTTTYPLLTHTGCGFSCNFCTAVMPGPYQNREVHRNPDDVVAEMRAATAVGFDRFFMSANVFTSQRNRCLAFCEAVRDAGIADEATWVCMTRIEFVDEELLTKMSDAGCVNIAFGVETVGEDQWKALRKGRYREEAVSRAFQLTKDVGIGTTAFLMLGTPEQTPDDIEATLRLIRRINPDYRVVSFFQPFPGTAYWDRKADFGLSEIAPLQAWNFHEAPVCRTRTLTRQFLQRAAVRLHLDRQHERQIDVDTDVLELSEAFLSTAAAEDEPWLTFVEENRHHLPLNSLLEELERRHGSRARLIALYRLSGHIADGSVQLESKLHRENALAHENANI